MDTSRSKIWNDGPGRIFSFLFPALAVLILGTSCSTAPTPSGPIAITKVNPYHLKPGMYVKTDDAMIQFEQRHHLHGAVTSEEYADKFGNYYTVFWKSERPGTPVTIRFEYRQANTGPEVHRIDANVTAKKKNTTKFRVNGNFYTDGGPVTSWRVVILENGVEIAENKSFLWK
ncbi:MAG: hypothetical protein HKN23_10385 [Verrucomicrobiales bacterium]|nr:hypothetical protein [Verrucomicrobiales bacterium]